MYTKLHIRLDKLNRYKIYIFNNIITNLIEIKIKPLFKFVNLVSHQIKFVLIFNLNHVL